MKQQIIGKISVLVGMGALVATLGMASIAPVMAAGPGAADQPIAPVSPLGAGDDATSARLADLQAPYAEREALYQGQITAVDGLFSERQATYVAQVEELMARVEQGQAAVDALTAQELTLTGQVTQLWTLRQQRQAEYQNNLAVAGQQYAERAQAMSVQLAEAQARLLEARTLLGQ